ncbi:N-acetylmuramoyl-L-alanine amidase family protein [Campylobacter sp.]|uniref:N-acetylmuramoyl-L-alanine amidase family protein n=1 Tax=Campylobacter sp. TaxID=205 RepID=UPI002A64ACFA|nr:N-acetylmuramoyl-L-alanine amidase [Campylobacter sp.]MDD7704488.1 N-acetylmuramoyl-L-alanine amidase [Campylobacteraceae bacterium]MDY2635117.1 N-acetylmuramoyl-L-alanine amidase [Campylobacter sp.]
MGKISRFLALITLFISVVFGACDFSEFDKNFIEVGAKERQRLHNEIKNAYIKSVINDDLECKKASLERLIKANDVFGVNSKTLKKELASLSQANAKNADENNTKKSTPKSQNSAEESKKETKNEAKNTEQKTKSRAAQTKEQKSQKVEAKVEAKTKVEAEPKSLRVLEVLSDKNSLKIKLNRDINEDELKNFTLNSKDSWRNVYDITGILPSKFPIPQNGISAKIRIAQKDPSTVRIVFEDAKKSQIYAQIDEKEITFSKKLAQNTQKAEQKIEQKTEQKAEQNTKKTAKKVASAEKTSASKAEKTVKTQNTKNDKKIAKKPEPVNQKAMKITADTATAASNKLSKKQKASKIIVLDPGHGGDDVGALSQNKKLREKDIVLNVSKKTASLLKERGYKVLFTRSNDRFIKLRSRTSFANDKGAHLFISIHANAAPNKEKAKSMNGIETFFLSPSRSERSMNAANLENKADTDEMNYFTKVSFLNFLNREKIIASNKLAIDMQAALLKSVRTGYKVSDGGVREAPFWVLVGALMPAVLIEIGYISHPDESQKIANSKYQDRLAKGIADGVDEYFAKNL